MECTKKIKKHVSFTVLILSLISFLLLYVNFQLSFLNSLFYLYTFLHYFFESFIAAVVAATLFASFGEVKKSRRFLFLFKLELPRLVFLVPYYYLYYLSDGYDSIYALFLLVPTSFFIITLSSIEALIYVLIARKFSNKRRESGNFFAKCGIFDFSYAAASGIFAISFSRFILNILTEIKDVIVYLIDYQSFYSLEEIYFVLAKFLLAFITLFISHILITVLRRKYE